MRAVAVFFVLLGALFASQSAQLRALLVSQSFPVVGELYGVDSDSDGVVEDNELIYLDLKTKKKCFLSRWRRGSCQENEPLKIEPTPLAYIVQLNMKDKPLYLRLSISSKEVAVMERDADITLRSLEWHVEDGKAFFVYRNIHSFAGVVAHCDTPGFVWDMERVGDTLYVADGEQGLKVYDIAARHLYQPKLIGEQFVDGEAIEVHVYNGSVFVGTESAIYAFNMQSLQLQNRYKLPGRLYFFRPTPFGLFVALVDGRCMRITAKKEKIWKDFDVAYITPYALYRYDSKGLAKLSLPNMRLLERYALEWGEVAVVDKSVAVAAKEKVEIARGKKVYVLQIGFEPIRFVGTRRYLYLLDSIARIVRIDPKNGESDVLSIPYPATDIVQYKRDLAIIGQGGAGFVIMNLK